MMDYKKELQKLDRISEAQLGVLWQRLFQQDPPTNSYRTALEHVRAELLMRLGQQDQRRHRLQEIEAELRALEAEEARLWGEGE